MRQPKQAKGTAESQVLAGNQHTPSVNRDVYGASSVDTAKTHDAHFWAKTAPSETGCILWLGATGAGYGIYTPPGEKRRGAHRHAYALANGPIPSGQVVRHSCDTPLCVNPNHLSAGTHRQNIADMMERDRSAGKLTTEQVIQIRAQLADGEYPRWLAKTYGVSLATILSIRRGETYKHAVHTAASAHRTEADGWFAGGPAFPADGFGLLARDVVPWRRK